MFKKKLVAFALFTLTLVISCLAAQPDDNIKKAQYKIGAGDLIEVSVWNHAELTKEVSVRPDGWISLPLAGEVFCNGESPSALSETIREKLLQYLKDPNVSVIVSKYKSKKILVLGEVKKPGMYQYEGGLTAFDAIGLAEGYNSHAQLKSILVVRNPYSKPVFYVANLYKVIHDADMRENIALFPGDVVYVPENFIGNLGDFMDYWIQRIRPAADTFWLYKLAMDQ